MSWPSRSSSTIGTEAAGGGGIGVSSVSTTLAGAGARTDHIVGVQKRGTLQPYFNEGSLHARHDPLHLALVDIAHHAPAPTALDMQLLQHAVLDHRHTGLTWGDVDQNLFRHQCAPKAVSNCEV